MVPYLPRLVDAQLDRILATFPAALVLGPRASVPHRKFVDSIG